MAGKQVNMGEVPSARPKSKERGESSGTEKKCLGVPPSEAGRKGDQRESYLSGGQEARGKVAGAG